MLHSLGVFCFLPLLSDCLSSRSRLPGSIPAKCSLTSPLTSEIQREVPGENVINALKRVSLTLDQGETACLYFHDGSQDGNETIAILHIIQYTNFHQSYPIASRYTFGIPYLKSSCFCDCPGGESRCSPNLQYVDCTVEGGSRGAEQGAICGRTYHPNLASIGCQGHNDMGASVCCHLTVSPYKGWKFVAVDISQPTAFGEIVYKIYHNSTVKWSMIANKTFQIPLDKSTQVLPDGAINHFRVTSSSPVHALNSGMYFYRDSLVNSPLRTGPALNRPSEWSMTKLGWFRFNSSWYTDKKEANLQRIVHIKVLNCKDQRYVESFQAGYSVSDLDQRDEFDVVDSYIGTVLNERELWVSAAYPSSDGRQILITHRHPPAVTMELQINTSMDAIRFVHHRSFFEDFRAEIRLDAWSNRYLRLVLIDCSGTVTGIVYDDEKRGTNAVSFSTTNCGRRREEEFLIALPSSVNRSRYVCVRTDHVDEKCAWAQYHLTPIITLEGSANGWIERYGDCRGCNNEEGSTNWSNFLTNLNPVQWLNGISGSAEWLAFSAEMILYLVIVLLAVALCRRLVCPVVKWAICKNDTGGSKE